MGWQNFRYMTLHAARDAGVSALSSNNGFVTGDPADNLIDSMAGYTCRLDGSAADHYLEMNRGAAGLEEIDRLYIPVGHNFNGYNVQIETSDTGAWGGEEDEILASAAITSAAAINLALGGSEADRKQQYVRMNFIGTFQPELTELIYTHLMTPTVGPMKGWIDMLVHNTQDFPKRSGVVASLSLGADRRLIELTYRDVDVDADLAIFSDLIETCGTTLPFLVDHMFDTEDTMWMKLRDDSQQQQDEAVPASTDSPMKQIELAMLQHLA